MSPDAWFVSTCTCTSLQSFLVLVLRPDLDVAAFFSFLRFRSSCTPCARDIIAIKQTIDDKNSWTAASALSPPVLKVAQVDAQPEINNKLITA